MTTRKMVVLVVIAVTVEKKAPQSVVWSCFLPVCPGVQQVNTHSALLALPWRVHTTLLARQREIPRCLNLRR